MADDTKAEAETTLAEKIIRICNQLEVGVQFDSKDLEINPLK